MWQNLTLGPQFYDPKEVSSNGEIGIKYAKVDTINEPSRTKNMVRSLYVYVNVRHV